MSKINKTLLIITTALVTLIVILFIFISPVTKYLVEKYDFKFTGRQITMDWAYVNPFTGYVYFNNLKICEENSDSVFISAKGLKANIEINKLFYKSYELSEISLDHPSFTIIQDHKTLNISDLIKRFSPNDNDTTKSTLHLNLLNMKINDAKFSYKEKHIPIDYTIKKLNISSTGKWWNRDTIQAKFSFLPLVGTGEMNGNITINFKTLDYKLTTSIKQYNLQIIEQYLKELTNYGTFSATLDANIKAIGNFNDAEKITASGSVAINDFHFGKTRLEDYASFDKLSLKVNEISPEKHKYLLESVELIHPFLKYERYDNLDNIQTMFGKKGVKIIDVKADPTRFNLVLEIARYVKIIAKNFFRSYYKINRLDIKKADLQFNDYSTPEKFSIALNPLNISADSIDKNHSRVKVAFNSAIKPFGKVDLDISINPRDSSDFDMKYKFQKLPASLFNPYLISLTSYPLDRGTIEINGSWKVRNGDIKSINHLVIIDPRLTTRLKNKDIKWLPMNIIMAFVRERGNVIDYEIPITGNLKNPKFNLHDVIFDILRNIFVKPPTTLYRIQVKSVETEIEKLLSLKWEMRQTQLSYKQVKFIKRMANFLKHNPEASITVSPQLYSIKEKEYILFFEAKKKYYLEINKKAPSQFNEKDKDIVEKLSVKDPVFITYLNISIKRDLLFTIQDKCSRLIPAAKVNIKFNELIKARETVFLSYFQDKDVVKRIHIAPNENVIPYNGFSFYKIKYKGEFPKSLIKAYKKIDELNEESPRKEFKEERQKTNKL